MLSSMSQLDSAEPADQRPVRGRPRPAGLAERRRSELTDAAFEVFVEKGYDGASIGDIAKRVGIGQGTLYRYVEGKRELLDLVFDKCVDQLISAVSPDELVEMMDLGGASLPQQVAKELGDRLFQLVDANPGLLKMLTIQAGAVDEELRYRIQGLSQTLDGMIGRAVDTVQAKGWDELIEPEDDDDSSRLIARLLPALVLPGLVLTLSADADQPDRRAAFVGATGELLRRGILTERKK